MSYEKPRISAFDPLIDNIVAMSEGNPGAMTVLSKMLTTDIDPESVLGPIGSLLMLDNMDIYGSKIWILYKDVCNQSIEDTIGLLRACQMGIVTWSFVTNAVDGIEPISSDQLEEVIIRIKEELPGFGTTNVVRN